MKAAALLLAAFFFQWSADPLLVPTPTEAGVWSTIHLNSGEQALFVNSHHWTSFAIKSTMPVEVDEESCALETYELKAIYFCKAGAPIHLADARPGDDIYGKPNTIYVKWLSTGSVPAPDSTLKSF